MVMNSRLSSDPSLPSGDQMAYRPSSDPGPPPPGLSQQTRQPLNPPPGFNSPAGEPNGAGLLENRLRSLILNNSPIIPGFSDGNGSGKRNSNGNGQEGQSDDPKSQEPQANNAHAGKAPKKRPNQAQRRQMSAQLAITFDPRPPLPQTARPYVSPTTDPSHPHQHPRQVQRQQDQHHQNPHTQQQYHKSNGAHSATFRPSGYSNNFEPVPSPGVWRPQSNNHQLSSDALAPPFGAPSPRMAFQTSGHGNGYTRSENQFGRPLPSPAELDREAMCLEGLATHVLSDAEIEMADIAEKEGFRQRIELLCQDAIARHETTVPDTNFPAQSVQLRCFGSLSSGFATKASDMDLGLFSPFSHSQPEAPDSSIPRILEKALLDAGLGARLITRTRVPIIKLCEKPTEKLRRDLLEEREKWERGISSDHGDGVEDDHDDQDEMMNTDGLGEVDEDNYSHRLTSLRQQNRQTLSSYYGMAKRVLRRLNGQDIRISNISDFSERDFNVLTDVCRAYLRGLADAALRGRLEKYSSLSFPEPSTPSLARSLLGVSFQVEGEVLVVAWENRIVRERDDRAEDECQRFMEAWKDLQKTPGYGLDTLGYNKELQLRLERMRKIPSLQLRVLDQGLHESAVDYYRRVLKLIADLGPRNHEDTFVENYISGIRNDQVRAAVSVFASRLQTKSLAAVARRHKVLHLALEYERALEKSLYSSKQTQMIQDYVKILSGPEGESASSPTIPVTATNAAIINAVRSFPGPSTMACNQPRDQYRDKLEFPSSGIGVQCDINFSAHLALQNTILLRCYSHTDPRVQPLVLCVKHWAKMRNINEAYRGTLNSYGYVLMTLHYLVNVAEPFVCPNLQELGQAHPGSEQMCKGRDVRFWRDEEEIKRLASQNLLNQNQDSIGALIRGFFEYFAERGPMRDGKHRGFDWGRDVLSLRTHGGLLSKQQKGWTGAKTVIQLWPSKNNECDVPKDAATTTAMPTKGPAGSGPGPGLKEVRHRYLFAIEDPFELDHNVARTVTHNGIVAIRDEFRRAWRLIQAAGRGQSLDELLVNAKDGAADNDQSKFANLLGEIHGFSPTG
ncbi:hypothetical protein MKZ38_008805 [Zalerion maritima]|uniref:polynucleotide adenylyltransferase n=1 Tax=Zalerion maritima TaxID=339359 RepID=A0AAD5WMJ5_9PEZI|nr:hypothetical protein MKZ38_008805 [Zalerion maritima]